MSAVAPLNPANWGDFVDLMGGEGGGCGGCWCTWWRMSRSRWNSCSKEQRRTFFKQIVDAGEPVGILLYESGQAVGWCAVAPRADYPTLMNSPVAYPIDESDSWCVSCLFVRAGWRRQGRMEALIRAGAAYAFGMGAPAVDGFPQKSGRTGFVDRFIGLEGSFHRAGFTTVEQRGENRVAVRQRRPQDRLAGAS
jgi:GNAT superfamily N-acetyltransferase